MEEEGRHFSRRADFVLFRNQTLTVRRYAYEILTVRRYAHEILIVRRYEHEILTDGMHIKHLYSLSGGWSGPNYGGKNANYTGLFRKKYKLSKMYFTTTDAKSMSCVRMERKSLKSSDLNLPPGVRCACIIVSAKGSCVQNGGKRTGESFLRAGIRQDNVSVKCATTFPDTLWKESA
jgi:hypothetical protein